MAEQEMGPTPEQIVEQIRRMKVSDVLLSSLSTTAQLGFAKLDQPARDLEQAKLAIEALKALLPVLEGTAPDEVLKEFQAIVSNLQLAYAGAVAEAGKAGDGEPQPDSA